MFNPELLYVTDENEYNNQISQVNELMIVLFICSQNIIYIISYIYTAYLIKVYLVDPLFQLQVWTMLWSSLSPGRQYLELVFIVSSIAIPVLTFLLVSEMEKVIKKMKQQIVKLENELQRQK
jgi:hypothetical protein